MVAPAPTALESESVDGVRQRLAATPYPVVEAVCVLDDEGDLVGLIEMAQLAAARPESSVAELMKKDPPAVLPETDQEHCATLALRHDLACLPVVNPDHSLAGVIPARTLLAILRREHVEDLHRLAGIRRESTEARLALEQPPVRRVRHRLPWLLLGLLGSLIAAVVVSRFERLLAAQISIAFFVPTIVYLADAIGTQTEAIAVRGLSVSRRPLGHLLDGELRTGAMLGALIGAAAFGLILVGMGDASLALAVGLAIFAAGAVAAAIGLLLPWLLHRFGMDPAFGSGPLATVIQDVLSVAIYLGLATALVT